MYDFFAENKRKYRAHNYMKKYFIFINYNISFLSQNSTQLVYRVNAIPKKVTMEFCV